MKKTSCTVIKKVDNPVSLEYIIIVVVYILSPIFNLTNQENANDKRHFTVHGLYERQDL